MELSDISWPGLLRSKWYTPRASYTHMAYLKLIWNNPSMYEARYWLSLSFFVTEQVFWVMYKATFQGPLLTARWDSLICLKMNNVNRSLNCDKLECFDYENENWSKSSKNDRVTIINVSNETEWRYQNLLDSFPIKNTLHNFHRWGFPQKRVTIFSLTDYIREACFQTA